MRNLLTALLVLCLFKVTLLAQPRFGNEWINFNQEYYKIQIVQNGIYRISYNTLVNAGLNVGAINPKHFQLFGLGNELPIYIFGEDDNTFNPGDFIEFYAKKNDGVTDIPLYRTPQEQPHTFYSLYTDTSAYFLTWSVNNNGKRLSNYKDTAFSNYTAETYFMHTINTTYQEAYYDGIPYSEYGVLSEYAESKGYLGGLFGRGGANDRDIPTLYPYAGGPNPFVDLLWFGRTDAVTPPGQSNNHHLVVKVSPDNNNFRELLDTVYKGFTTVRRRFNLNNSDIGAGNTRFNFFIPDDLGVLADNHCIGGIFLTYPRTFELDNKSIFNFKLRGLQPGTSSLVRMPGYDAAKSNPIIYDNTFGWRIWPTLNAGTLSAIIPNAGSDKDMYICDTTDILYVGGLEKVVFQDLNIPTGNYDYLIITNEKLLAGANDYAAYRTTTGFKPLVVTTQQLYNQFYYGLHHPMALRNFCDFALEKSPDTPKYLLLLGKGQLHYYLRFDPVSYSYDLVPTMGSPASDYLITSGLKGTFYEPAIPTGRIPAIDNNDIKNYLDKLKEYEKTPPQLWQKNILHLAGGRNVNENRDYTVSLNKNRLVIEGPKVGGKTKLYSKDQAVTVSTGLKLYIQKDIENGLGMLTYLGHGASDILEIDFGGPAEIKNKGKYPIMMLSGCLLGNSFTKGSLGEKYILYPNGGVLGWISNTGYGFNSELDAFNNQYYLNVGVKSYAKGVGDIMKQTIADYQVKNFANVLNAIHSRQYAYEGDPALKFYFRPEPDYIISNMYVATPDVTALSDSFAVAVVMSNSGMAVNDSLNITLRRTLPDKNSVLLPPIRAKATYYSDTVFFWIKSKDINTKGMNYFDAVVDAGLEISESNETNNSYNIQFFMPSEGAQIISPSNYGIVNKTPFSLKAQSSKIDGLAHDFIFEIDTNANFNSPFKLTSPVISSKFIAEWNLPVLTADSSVFYWRVKLTNSTGNEAWQSASFIYLSKSEGGWSQKHFQQFSKISTTTIFIDTIKRSFNFNRKTSSFYSLNTYGQDGFWVRTHNQNYWPTKYGVIGNGISIISYDPDNENRFTYNSKYDPPSWVPDPFAPGNTGDATFKPSGTFFFNTKDNPEDRDSLREHIKRIPDGNYIFIHNGTNTGIDDWDTSLINAFKSIGAKKLGYLKEGWPYYLMTRKNPQPDDAIYEETADTVNVIAGPPLQQNLTKFTQMYPLTRSGSMKSEWVSGAVEWHKVYLKNKGIDNVKDSFYYNIIGRNNNLNEVTLLSGITADSVNIASISAAQYPQIRIEAFYKDDALRTAMQLYHWLVTYEELPEACVNTSSNYSFYKDTLQEGDSVRFQLAFQNISKSDMDSIPVEVKLFGSDNKETLLVAKKLKPLYAGDTVIFAYSFPTIGMSGNYKLQIAFNPGQLPEQWYGNNVFQKTFRVTNDHVNPMLDVTFDGVHINNNEIITPTPLIVFTATDENRIRLINDTQYFKINLKYPNGTSQRINFNTPQITFTPADTLKRKAVIEFKPDYLADGIYTLSANVVDVSGNKAGVNDYSINFEVISKATVTNFYPYPNPVNNAMRFVFTLTGQTPPDDIKIQIATITGKVVKTITKEELGSIHIGNNISNVVWNGTDEYGDKLANGVYLYKVIINDKKNTYQLRATAGDEYFKNNEKDINKNMGKIYLLR